jgi:hypothetical protein
MDPKKFMNPYLAGFLLGLLLLVTIFITGRGLGASGAVKSAVVATMNSIMPSHTEVTHFYQEYREEHSGNPMKNWLVFEMGGVIIGAFISGLISNRLTLKLEQSCIERNGGIIGRRDNYDGGYIWRSVCVCILFQKTLDIKKRKINYGTISS